MSSEITSPITATSFGARVFRGAVWGQVGKILETVLTLGFTILVVRQLGPIDYGQYGLISSVVVVTGILTALGAYEILGSQVPRLLAEGNARGARRLTLQVSAARLGAVLLGVIVLVVFRNGLAVLFKTPDFGRSAVWIGLLAVLTSLGELALVLLTALLDMRFVALARSAGMGLSIAAALALFGWQGVSVQLALIASAAGWAVIIALAASRSLVKMSTWRTGAAQTPAVIKYGLTVWMGNLLNLGLTVYSSVFLLGILASDTSQVGFYNVAVLPVGRLWTVMVAGMATVMLPTLAEAGARHGAVGLARVWRAYVSLFILLLLPAYGFLIVYAHPLISLLFGAAYLPAAGLMQLYLGLALLGTLFVGTATINLFYATGRQTWVVVTSALGGVINIGLLILLIPRFNAFGAILADGLAGLTTGLLLFALLKRELPMLRYPAGLVLRVAGATVGALGVAYVIVPPHGSIYRTVPSIALGGLVFVGLCVWLKPLAGLDLPLERLGTRVNWIARFFGESE